jgi:hypothetical protein
MYLTPKTPNIDPKHILRMLLAWGKVKFILARWQQNILFFEDVFKNNKKEDENKYEKVIARDIMKQGVIRFSTPFYRGGKLFGVIVLSLDYRHFQELA